MPGRETVPAHVFEHERGLIHSGAGTIFLESGPLEIAEGSNVYMIRYIYPDEKALGQVSTKVMAAFHPTGPETTFGPFASDRPTSVRLTGRQLRVRFEQEADNTDWRVGEFRMDAALAGER